MHHIYTTPAFVVHSTSHGEAGKFLLIFTKDFGMIGVVAQGIRLNQSKLRYHVQDFSYCLVSIVKGKDVWRLTGANEIKRISKSSLLHFKILKLLKRLLQGEEKNERLFNIIENLYQTNIDNKDSDIIECLIVVRMLYELGYVSNKELSLYLEGNTIDDDILNNVRKNKVNIVKIINLALKESQL